VLNCVSALVRRDAQCCYRRRVVDVTRQVQLLLGRIVMVAQKIVRLQDLDVIDLRRLQNFARAFSSGDVPARAHLAPPAKCAAHANLRPKCNDQRDANVEEPVRTQTKTVRAADKRQAARAHYKAQ